MPMSVADFKSKVIGKISEQFEVKEISKHHIYYEIWFRGQKIAVTHHSHGIKEIDDSVLSLIKRQLKLDNINQLHELKRCLFTSENYLNLLEQKNVIGN